MTEWNLVNDARSSNDLISGIAVEIQFGSLQANRPIKLPNVDSRQSSSEFGRRRIHRDLFELCKFCDSQRTMTEMVQVLRESNVRSAAVSAPSSACTST